MRMIAAGLTPKKIAGELCLSVKTINSYRIRILEKMNIKTNAELIRYALENKLIE
jgi:DNA-binding NarL/FixJ family response regulator